ncbi:MAG TPA: hypothetical protein VF245_00915 [Solirubrobacterales bacterium]
MSEKALAECERTDVDYRIQVAYRVPVEVIVDLRRGTVDRVVVIDEGGVLDQEAGVRQESTLHPVSLDEARRATEIAEAGNWPVWEHGF